MKKRKTFALLIYIAILVLAFSWMMGLFSAGKPSLTYSQIVTLFQNKQVESFKVVGEKIELKLHQPYEGETKFTCSLANPERFREELWDTILIQQAEGVITSYNFLPGDKIEPFDFVLPLIVAG